MSKKNISIEYLELNSINELPENDLKLFQCAIDATKGAYAPYSNFKVGAAVRLEDGTILHGSNQENIAFPSGICAERNVIFSTHANYPEKNIEAIAITAFESGEMVDMPTYPCGACRQVMIESQKRAGKNIKVIIGGKKRIEVFKSVSSLLPFVFDNFLPE